MPSFGQWTYTADRDATLLAYGRAERGWADKCGCVECRNFKLARLRTFPAAFLALLDELGIDPGKEAEVSWARPSRSSTASKSVAAKYPGLEHFMIHWAEGIPPKEFKEQFRWFAKDVMPAFR